MSGNYNSDDLPILEEVHFAKSIYDRISKYVGHSNEDKSLVLNSNGEIKIWYKKEKEKPAKVAGILLIENQCLTAQFLTNGKL